MSDASQHDPSAPRARPEEPMTADAYLAWAVEAEIRAELYGGRIVMMSPESGAHAVAKRSVFRQIDRQLGSGPCEVWMDGMAVRAGSGAVFEPDVFVRCGEDYDPAQLSVDDPVVIFEIASPSTSRVDATKKLFAYLSLPSLTRYVRILLDERAAFLHWRRDEDGTIALARWRAEDGPLDIPFGDGRTLRLDLAAVCAEALTPRGRRSERGGDD